MHGRDGQDVVIKVPLGTVVSEGNLKLADLTKPGQRYCAAKGGQGGRGNQHFATSTRQAPRYAEKGKPGEERSLILELKIIADVGIIGLPNAGKSTLLAHITHATPKIAPYPFTTIHPNLGIYEKEISGEHIVMADIPGLIEGASRGAGLGDRFLRHIERTRILVHLIAFDEITEDFSDLFEKYEMVLHELSVYSDKLLQKPQILLLNKIDLVSAKKVKEAVQGFRKRRLKILPVSAKEKKGLDALVSRIEEILDGIQASNEDDSKKE
jgi:GTP-binding protein